MFGRCFLTFMNQTCWTQHRKCYPLNLIPVIFWVWLRLRHNPTYFWWLSLMWENIAPVWIAWDGNPTNWSTDWLPPKTNFSHFFQLQHFSFQFHWLWAHSNDILWRADIFATLPPTTPHYTAVLGLTVRFVCDPSCELPPCPLYGDSVGTTRTSTFHIKALFIVYKPLTRLHKAHSAPWIWLLWCSPAIGNGMPKQEYFGIFGIIVL